MNVYDFDKTIYQGDSTLDFYFFCVRRHPSVILCLPHQMSAAAAYALKRCSKTLFKEKFYCFLKQIGDIDIEVSLFWNLNEHKIKKWYLEQKQPDDLVISASPQFLLNDICKRLEISEPIASAVDKNSGKYTGLNCYGEEKVRRFREKFPDKQIDCFYSDSRSDEPMARIARQAFLVSNVKITNWLGD